ncbi:MAG: hypothetical protein NT007_06905 [Candidatus Kapabacteria bacterium]|nr:hypothetical protein [Candidatus Kapabacteria bacterium]
MVYFDKTAFCQGCFDIDKNSVLDALKQIKNKRYCKQIKVLSVVDCSREIEFKNYQKKFSFLPYSFWNKGSLYEDLNIPKTTAVVIFDAKLNVLATFDYSIRTGFSKDIYKIIQNYFKINNNIRSQN